MASFTKSIKKSTFGFEYKNALPIIFVSGIGTNGKLTKKYSGSNSLPFIFGKPDISEFLELKKIIDQSQFSFSQIKKLYFFPSRRWDLEIQDNILIKLPNYHIKDSLNYANEFLNNNKEIKFKTIDIRIKDQIILYD
mgnify:CR=1 FL=1